MASSRSRSPFGALLLDLDGTLLDVRMSDFLEGYFPLLAPRFGAEGDLEGFRNSLLTAVRAMMHHRSGEMTLEEVFLLSFSPAAGMPAEAVRETFREFYLQEFESLRARTRPRPEARPLVERALGLGYDLALATNPVFFHEAIAARLRWAGLADVPFAFISAAENMHACKPHPEYFLEVAAHMGRRPGECIMVGDDPVKDLPASRVGITTFYSPMPGERRRPGSAGRTGSLADLLRWLEELGPV